MPYVETVEEFCRAHGAMVKVGPTRHLFTDGAVLISSSLGPSWYAPPADDALRLALQIEYQRARLGLLETAFKQLKDTSLGLDFHQPKWQACFGPLPERHVLRDDEAALRVLSTLAKEARKTLADLESERNSLPAVQAEQRRQAAEEAARESTVSAERNRRQRIEKIRI